MQHQNNPQVGSRQDNNQRGNAQQGHSGPVGTKVGEPTGSGTVHSTKIHDVPKSITASDIFRENNTDLDKVLPTEIISDLRKRCTHVDIVASKYKLFFVKYTPERTLCQRCYLVQVNIEATLEMNKDNIDIDS